MIGKLIDYVYRVKRGVINPTPQKSIAEYTPSDANFDEQILMSVKLARDPYKAREVLQASNETPWDMIKDLPIGKIPNPLARLWGWLARLEGALPYIPYQNERYNHETDNRQDFKQPSNIHGRIAGGAYHRRRYKR